VALLLETSTLRKPENLFVEPEPTKNCLFLDIVNDEVGPLGINVLPEKQLDTEAEWKYLEGMLASKVDNEIADRVKLAHLKLPTFFRTIETDKKIVYPFQYDYNTGVFKYPDLESNLQKNSSNASSKWHCVY